jgi:hypothetical protein
MLRILALAVAAVVVSTLPAEAARTPPALERTRTAVRAATSFRLTMVAGDSVIAVDFVRPNTYRLTDATSGRLAHPNVDLYDIDGTFYAKGAGARWKQIGPTQARTVEPNLDTIATFLRPELLGREQTSTIASLASYADFHDGKPVRQFRVVTARYGTLTLDVKNDRFVRIDMTRTASPRQATFFYDRYDAVAPIAAPI